jgi:membrane protein required for beta-lactamase induction
MNFIVMLLALAIERYFNWSWVRNWQWYDSYCHAMARLLQRLFGSWQAMLSIVPPVLLIAVLQYFLGVWQIIAYFLFSWVVLWVCIGPGNLFNHIYMLILGCARSEDTLINISRQALIKQLLACTNNETTNATATFAQLFTALLQNIFAVIFWFALLGPVGAVLYRCTYLSSANCQSSACSAKLLACLDWLPVRLLGLLFALAGNFVSAITALSQYGQQGCTANQQVLYSTASAALLLPPEQLSELSTSSDHVVMVTALKLFDRAVLMFLVLVALLLF